MAQRSIIDRPGLTSPLLGRWGTLGGDGDGAVMEERSMKTEDIETRSSSVWMRNVRVQIQPDRE
ncbi:hypothetical protein ZHAS_00009523 [Anopheles sinensis]|uniref:Uncharacterized protein n=1 Tax=Anopheles sinensis TaxID=74873 RepID=A0A084VVG1_ANOSI|nr:hypothetical protein ZHAS_00009523 [Anopheles sinensis]